MGLSITQGTDSEAARALLVVLSRALHGSTPRPDQTLNRIGFGDSPSLGSSHGTVVVVPVVHAIDVIADRG